MNLVRLCAIFGTQVIAGYAIWVYSAIPAVAPLERVVETKCMVSSDSTGVGMIVVALAAIGAGLTVAFTDLIRRMY